MLVQEFLNIYKYETKIENISSELKFSSIKEFVKTVRSVYVKLKKIINIKFTKRLETFFEKTFYSFIEKNTKLDRLETSNLVAQVYKLLVSTFETVHKVVEIYPLAILCIVYVIIRYKINNPTKPVTKRVILKATKLFLFELNLMWSKYKAKGGYEQRMHVFIVPFMCSYLLILLSKMSSTFAIQIYKVFGNSFEPLKALYLLWTSFLLINSVEMSGEYLEHLA